MVIDNVIIKYFLSELRKYMSGNIIPLADKSNPQKVAFVRKWHHSNFVDFRKIHTKKDFNNVLAIIEKQLIKPIHLS